jgi:hypothetical protein
VSAFISGGASAVTAGFVVSAKDPQHYGMGTANFFEVVMSVFAMAGFLNMMSFLRTKALPEMKTVVTTTQTTDQGLFPTKVVTTVAETHTEPVVTGPKVS